MNQQCSVVQKHLFQTLAESDIRHLRQCEHCARTLRQAISLEAMVKEEVAEQSMEDVSLFSTTETFAALVVHRSRAQMAIRNAGIVLPIVILGTVAILWLYVSGTLMGRSPFLRLSRAAWLVRSLPYLYMVTTVFGFVLGIAISGLGRLSSLQPRNVFAWAGGLTFFLVAEYRIAKIVAAESPEYFWIPLTAALLTAATIAYLGNVSGFPYKRLFGRRQVSGVCLGLAEATGWSVALIRTLFVGAIFLKLHGVLLYLVFDALMEVHPDERARLLRFRIRRWWRNRIATAEA